MAKMICPKRSECTFEYCKNKIPHEKDDVCFHVGNRFLGECPMCVPVEELGEDVLLGATNSHRRR
jgi:hypothetical protein